MLFSQLCFSIQILKIKFNLFIIFAEPGVLAFTKPSFVIKESGLRALIPVGRTGGADGHVSVKWKTKDITAVNAKDYEGGEGELLFDNQETSKCIDIILFESNVSCKDLKFNFRSLFIFFQLGVTLLELFFSVFNHTKV